MFYVTFDPSVLHGTYPSEWSAWKSPMFKGLGLWVKILADNILKDFSYFFPENRIWNVKSCFLLKNKKSVTNFLSAQGLVKVTTSLALAFTFFSSKTY